MTAHETIKEIALGNTYYTFQEINFKHHSEKEFLLKAFRVMRDIAREYDDRMYAVFPKDARITRLDELFELKMKEIK